MFKNNLDVYFFMFDTLLICKNKLFKKFCYHFLLHLNLLNFKHSIDEQSLEKKIYCDNEFS